MISSSQIKILQVCSRERLLKQYQDSQTIKEITDKFYCIIVKNYERYFSKINGRLRENICNIHNTGVTASIENIKSVRKVEKWERDTETQFTVEEKPVNGHVNQIICPPNSKLRVLASLLFTDKSITLFSIVVSGSEKSTSTPNNLMEMS